MSTFCCCYYSYFLLLFWVKTNALIKIVKLNSVNFCLHGDVVTIVTITKLYNLVHHYNPQGGLVKRIGNVLINVSSNNMRCVYVHLFVLMISLTMIVFSSRDWPKNGIQIYMPPKPTWDLESEVKPVACQPKASVQLVSWNCFCLRCEYAYVYVCVSTPKAINN